MGDAVWLRNQVVAPVTEELVFRGALLPMLVPCAGPTAAIFTAPLFFGVGMATRCSGCGYSVNIDDFMCLSSPQLTAAVCCRSSPPPPHHRATAPPQGQHERRPHGVGSVDGCTSSQLTHNRVGQQNLTLLQCQLYCY